MFRLLILAATLSPYWHVPIIKRFVQGVVNVVRKIRRKR
jgi:hypothetical protein